MTFDYSIFITHPLLTLTYLLLALSLISLWLPCSFTLWAVLLSCGFLAGLFSHALDVVSAIPILLLLFAAWVYKKLACRLLYKSLWGVLCLVVSVGLFLHLFPGFHNWKILSGVVLSRNAVTYTLRLNFDKPIVALALIAFGQELLKNKNDWRRTFLYTLPLAAIGVPLLIGLAPDYFTDMRIKKPTPLRRASPFIFFSMWYISLCLRIPR